MKKIATFLIFNTVLIGFPSLKLNFNEVEIPLLIKKREENRWENLYRFYQSNGVKVIRTV